MNRITTTLAIAFAIGLVSPGQGPARDNQDDPKALPKFVTENKNAMIKEYKNKLQVTASTTWPGWEPEKLLDGNAETSWFSAGGDAAAKGTKPWVMVTFPDDVTITRVSIVGNREPSWFDNFTVLSGMIEYLDADGKRIDADEKDGAGNRRDFEFKPKKPVKKVRSVKFISLKDEGDKNGFDDIAIGEILIE